MSGNSLPCRRCHSDHHPTDCPLDDRSAMIYPDTPHFTAAEWRSPIYQTDDRGRYVRRANGRCIRVGWTYPPPSVYRHLRRLFENLETIRRGWGRPISPTPAGGWRSQHANRAYRGRATRSKHLLGLAVDIKVRNMAEGIRLYKLIRTLIREGKISEGGLALYRGYVHYDCRGTRARWGLRVPK